MSLASVYQRIVTIDQLFSPASQPVQQPAAPASTVPPGTAAPGPGPSLAAALGQATNAAPAGGQSAMVASAQAEVGQTEQPPGSNDSPRIAEYRSAVPGGGVGPWCAYFASWVAAKNGTPLGERGQGFALVDDVYAWAQRTGRAVPNGPGTVPKPGDLIIWDEHMGIVEAVRPDGSIQTIEGNASDQVLRRTYPPDGGKAVGYVRMS